MHAEPRAELHVYYGTNSIADPEFKATMNNLLSRPGIMDHGRQPMEIIAREKHMSSFHIYLTNIDSEIDCITVKESCLTGAIPILSKHGVFNERDGIHFELTEGSPVSYAMIAVEIVKLMRDPNLDILRQQLKKSKHIINWSSIASKWLELL